MFFEITKEFERVFDICWWFWRVFRDFQGFLRDFRRDFLAIFRDIWTLSMIFRTYLEKFSKLQRVWESFGDFRRILDSLGTLSRSFREFRKVFGYFFVCQTVFFRFTRGLREFQWFFDIFKRVFRDSQCVLEIFGEFQRFFSNF